MIERLRPRSWSLSLRITATFALSAALISATVAISTSWFTMRVLVHTQEEAARHQTYVNAAIVRSRLVGRRRDVPSILDDLSVSGDSTKLIYSQSRWYSSSLLVSRRSLPAALRAGTLAGRVSWQWRTAGGPPEIVVGVPIPAAGGAYFQIFDESSVQRTAAVLRTVLLAAAATTTAVGALVGWGVGRRLSAPLRVVAKAAARIAAGDLDTQLPEERDRELARVVESFNAMTTALKRRIVRDGRFAADVSHELKSPLTTLRTAFSVVHHRRDELSDRGRTALELMGTELARFDRMVQDLLEISRADAETSLPEGEPVRVCALAHDLLCSAPFRGATEDYSPEAVAAVVPGDRRRLEQMLRNVLENAVVYGGGVTTVIARCADGTLTIAVDDAGPGVPPADRERIFERFARGNGGQRRSHRGTGLGLALVREHARAHHGSVTVTDAPSGGARFVIALPAEPA